MLDCLRGRGYVKHDAFESSRPRRRQFAYSERADEQSSDGILGDDDREEGRPGGYRDRPFFRALNEVRPANTIIEESPSNLPDLHTEWPITEPDTFYTFASGILGWNLPAAVGIALAERDSGRNRPVIVVIGDGSFQYSVQSLWSAVQLRLPLLIVVSRNDEYCVLKSFAVLEQTPGVPGLDIPGVDVVSIAKGYGCDAARVNDVEAIKKAAVAAQRKSTPTVLEIPISPQVPPLL